MEIIGMKEVQKSKDEILKKIRIAIDHWITYNSNRFDMKILVPAHSILKKVAILNKNSNQYNYEFYKAQLSPEESLLGLKIMKEMNLADCYDFFLLWTKQ